MPNLCKFLLILILIAFLNGLLFAQTLPELEKVKEIKLLESTRDDVRRILGEYKLSPYDNREYVNVFVSDNAEIEVYYSEGKCREYSDEWDVAEWVVTEITFTPQKIIQLNRLGLNLSKFKKENKYVNYEVPKLYYHKDLGIIVDSNQGKVDEIIFLPPQKYLLKMCDKKEAKKLLKNSSWLIFPLKERIYTNNTSEPPISILDLELSLVEIKSDCSSNDVNDKHSCIVGVKAKTFDSEANEFLTFQYKVSDGKIIGNGANVQWDLSDVKPGTYTITAAVDDGCGFCGKAVTKTVTVKECPDCKKP